MKILYYVHALTIGGAETIVTNNLLDLKANHVDVVLVVNQKVNTFLERRLLNAGIKIYALDRTMPQRFIQAFLWKIKIRLINYRRKFNKILANEKPDLIHVHSLMNRLYGINFPANRIIYTFHSDVERALRIYSKKNYTVLKKMSTQGLSFFALTSKAQDDVRKHFNTERIYVLFNSVNIDKIKNSGYDRGNFLAQLNIPHNAFIVGHVGRFHMVKNHEKIVDVFKEVRKRHKDAYLLLIGGDESGRMKLIKERVHNYGLDDYVRFLGVREDATSIVSCFNVFILPSFSESFSLVIVEAQALGVKCVVSDVVPKDVICNSNCLQISLTESDDDWANAVIKECDKCISPELYKFDRKKVIRQLICHYEKIAGQRN